VARARATWPSLTIDPAAFVAHVARLVRPGSDGAALEELFAADLYLACGCTLADGTALAAFEKLYVGAIDQILARLRLDGDVLAEAKQQVRQKLLVGAPPKISEYSGRGELRSWLHATATRTALNILRSRRRELKADDDHLLSLPAMGDDPEMRLLRQRYAAEFKAAFAEAMASLTPRQRVLIKRHFVDGVGTDGLGALYRVHRVTALRWLTDTRELLAKRTQHALWQRLGMQRAEFESVVRLVRSQLDFSIRELLGTEATSTSV
jgi:RNA polymerase sigma-70 factor (ECF subfamily)